MTEAELLAKHAGKCEANEALYIEVRTEITRRLQMAMNIRAALDSFDLKLRKIASEFDQELKTIEQNFHSVDQL